MQIDINGTIYEIREVSQKEYKEFRIKETEQTACDIKETEEAIKNGVYFGASHHYSCIIFLDKELPITRKRKTLMHELTHCYISEHITHDDKSFDEEMVADIVANSHDFIESVIDKYFKKYSF